MDQFRSALDQHFPGSMPTSEYIATMHETLQPLGFTPDRTLPLISICRDELTTELVELVADTWGRAFSLAGLAGVPALGRTGWGAAFSHIPNGERGRMLVIGCPHIGVDDDGTVGQNRRKGQSAPTATCGALMSLLARTRAGERVTDIDVDDYEASRLANRLIDPQTPPTSIVQLTLAALAAIETDLWAAINDAKIWRHHDVAVWCGVQIHGHDQTDYVWPSDAWFCGADGERHALARGFASAAEPLETTPH